MNGIEKITAKLAAEAQVEIEALRADSKAECDGILADYKVKAEAAYEAALKDGERACALRAERAASAAELDARKELLSFKQSLVSDVFTKAAAKLVSLPEAEYAAFLTAQVTKAAATGDEVLIFNAKDAAAVGKKVADAANKALGEKGRLTVSRETREIPGGVIVKQGDIETNCSVDMLVQLRRNDLASQVAEILFA